MLFGINKKRFVALWIFFFISPFALSNDDENSPLKLQNITPENISSNKPMYDFGPDSIATEKDNNNNKPDKLPSSQRDKKPNISTDDIAPEKELKKPPKPHLLDKPFPGRGSLPSMRDPANGDPKLLFPPPASNMQEKADAFKRGLKPIPGKKPSTKSERKNIIEEQQDILAVVPQKCVPAKGQFIWNFEDEMLLNILKQVSDLKCRTIVVPADLNQNLKLTIIGKSLMNADDAWAVTQAALGSKGLALVQQGATWTVIKRADSKNYSSPFYAEGREAPNDEGIGTLFYKTKHASVDSLKNIARALMSKDGLIDSIGDRLIYIDTNSNIKRTGRIFDEMDVEDALNKIRIIKLNHADAKVVEKQLRDLFDVASGPARGRRRPGSPEAGAGTGHIHIDKLIADDRTNSLLVLADNDSIGPFEGAVQLLDQPTSDQNTKGKIHVKKLRYADAKQMAETLSNVVSQGRKQRFGRPPRPGEGGETAAIFEGEVKITAHEDTNTLVTVASSSDYASLLSTINKLDARKDLVYVEAAILDISINGKNDFGINLFAGFDPKLPGGNGIGVLANPGGQSIASGIATSLSKDGSMDVGGLGKKSIGAIAVLGNFLSGGVAGIIGPNVGDTSIPSFGAVLTALSKNSNVDVLSTPYLLTADNKEAVMSVGEKVPVVRGASTVGGGAAGSALGIPLQNVSYEKVDLTFKITPHVGADDNVRLDVEQEVNELGGEVVILGQTQNRIRTKSAKSTIVLKDQQTGVIGGLISHRSSTADQKIPFLGDIPILGWLFKSRSSENDRKSLLLAITPYVIKSDEDYAKILERKMKEREEFAKLYYGGKIKNYDPHVDYDKKAGPLGSMINALGAEMQHAKNDGPGADGEMVITPKPNDAAEPFMKKELTPSKEPSTPNAGEKENEVWDEESAIDDNLARIIEKMPQQKLSEVPLENAAAESEMNP